MFPFKFFWTDFLQSISVNTDRIKLSEQDAYFNDLAEAAEAYLEKVKVGNTMKIRCVWDYLVVIAEKEYSEKDEKVDRKAKSTNTNEKPRNRLSNLKAAPISA